MTIHPKFTKQARDIIVNGLARGSTVTHLCHRARITTKTHYNWLAKAELGDPDFIQYAEDVAEAKGKYYCQLEERLDDLTTDSNSMVALQAIKFKLERTDKGWVRARPSDSSDTDSK